MFNPVIKWSGSKRSQAEIIRSFFPESYNTYFEPFIGGGSMLYAVNPKTAICGDICEPLVMLWKEIKENPEHLATEYKKRWLELQEDYQTYYRVRDEFNKKQMPADLLFLSRTCVNGLIRFNANGEFNNSLHHTRPGILPEKLEIILNDWSKRIQSTSFYAQDYELTTDSAKKGDIVYLDPPYFHTKGRYYGAIDFERFYCYLDSLNSKGIKYILSFDGTRGDDNYVVELPKDLYVRHELIPSGNSSFKKVMDKENKKVFESLYLNW